MLALAVVTVVLAIAAVLPIGLSAHVVALRTASAPSDGVLALAVAAAALGAVVAPLLVCAGRLGRLARDAAGPDRLRSELVALTVSGLVAAVGHATLEPIARAMGSTTVGAGLGLLATSVAVGSIGIAPSPTRRTITPSIAALAGLAVALGALPGTSSIALAIATLAWSGVAEPDAVETAALVAVPTHAVIALGAFASESLAAAADVPGPAVLAGALGVGGASLALAGLRRWTRGRTVAGAALWTGTLGLALLAHAYVAAS